MEQNSTCKPYLQVRLEGTRKVIRNTLHYSLPVILAVGYRVHSTRITQFRQWATQTLQEYLVKGFVMDDERLKNPPVMFYRVRDRSARRWLRIRLRRNIFGLLRSNGV
ncbi:RhuM family protein [Atlantibacter hermannii]|uniref:RhuM family protein n=1 Tax=Atlantibacter hermannii TaxID=565 RepID=UPI00406CDCFF